MMHERPMPIESVFSAIERIGLVPRGAMRLDEGERSGALADVRTIVLVGMVGRSGWDAFAASPEAGDGLDHPLDRWSRRVIDALARELGAIALYPFGGPAHFPFQQWALRSEPVHPSPIGLLIHPRYGLWHSYRGALGFLDALDVPAFAASVSPCEVVSRAPVSQRLSGGGVFNSRLRRRRLRGASERPRRRRLYGPRLPCAAGVPGRGRARAWDRAGGVHDARVPEGAGGAP